MTTIILVADERDFHDQRPYVGLGAAAGAAGSKRGVRRGTEGSARARMGRMGRAQRSRGRSRRERKGDRDRAVAARRSDRTDGGPPRMAQARGGRRADGGFAPESAR